jgi:serine/threonine protein kinase
MASFAAAELPAGKVVNARFRIEKSIGSGSFGSLYAAFDATTGKQVALKVEAEKADHPQLLYEARVLKELQGEPGVPRLLYSGQEDGLNYMGMELLGFNLEKLFEYCSRQFSIKTVLLLAIDMLARVEHVHARGFVHRDIKPDNFLFGLGPHAETLYLIDFGLSKCYREPGGAHIGYREDKHLTGTPRYASINNHEGKEQSRRDDLESLMYVLLYFAKGSLPWQGLEQSKKSKYGKVRTVKKNTSTAKLCAGLPPEFESAFTHIRALKFEDTPNYELLKNSFMSVCTAMNIQRDGMYDWTGKRRV